MRELENILWFGEILQPMRSHISQRSVRGKRLAHCARDQTGKQDLTTVADRHKPRAAVQGRAEVVVPAPLHLAAVHGHSHTQFPHVTPPFRVQGELGAECC